MGLYLRHFTCISSTAIYEKHLDIFILNSVKISPIVPSIPNDPFSYTKASAAFLMESNVVGSMSSKENTDALILTKGLKPILALRSLNV